MKLPKVYEPSQYESDIYDLWEKSQAFLPKDRGSNQTYSIVIPPPNANGDLHLGHGLTLGIEDIAIRYHRMKGDKTLFLPGADHAGFETWVVYEKQLAKEGKSRFDFSREELYKQIWDFVAQNKENYESQFRRLGASLDWSRYVYTLDEKVVKQAYSSFEKMFKEGLIYRAEKLVNFCTFHGTGFADIEVAYQEVKGHLWHIKYPLTDGSGEVVVATTRPETMLGDVAVAVHPDDKRYKELVGKTIKLPLTDREVPIITDDFVDTEFGTGAVKITPAHDPNDFEAGKRHSLAMITVIGQDGKITHNVPEAYRGLAVKEARKKVVSDLEDQAFLIKTEDHVHNVGHCYKCGTVIEPLLKEQWFIDMKPLTKPAIEALKANKITFYPESRKQQLIRYLEGLRDWNISRQIAWGIPIPAFQNIDNPEEWIFNTSVEEELIEVEGKTYRRDPDVFDTWFSSSSWPYATLDYPSGKDFNEFYPLSVMETGADILYPWVSRMLMFGLYNVGKIPFESVYLHGLINDEHGQKMSKSKGNVVNPMDKIDRYGSDAFRMGIIADLTAGNNRSFDESKLIAARNFCNKLWNIARYIEGELGDKIQLNATANPESIADHWILERLQKATEVTSEHLENYRFSDAYELLYHLIWKDVADWYIEASKERQNASVLNFVLQTILKLIHPFAPFVSETIWQTLQPEGSDLLIINSWPTKFEYNADKSQDFEKAKQIISETRHIKTLLQMKGGKLQFEKSPFVDQNKELICKLARLEGAKEVSKGRGLRLVETPENCWLDVDASTAQDFTTRLEQKKTDTTKKLEVLNKRLNNQSYLDKAPEQLVKESQKQLAEFKNELKVIEDQLEQFKKV